MSEWETFCDVSYYHLWRVRRKTERGFDDGFHLNNGEEARDLVELLNRMERERVEAQEDLEFRRGLSKVQEEYLETARRERDEANELLASEKMTRNHIIKRSVEVEQERDAAKEKMADALQEIDLRTLDFERMRHERDEAIRQFENLKATAIHTCHDQCQRPMCVLRRERDEARTTIEEAMEEIEALRHEYHGAKAMAGGFKDKIKSLTEAAVELRQKLASALVKRDEALEALMQIEDLFIDGTDIYADREKMGSIAREALRARNE